MKKTHDLADDFAQVPDDELQAQLKAMEEEAVKPTEVIETAKKEVQQMEEQQSVESAQTSNWKVTEKAGYVTREIHDAYNDIIMTMYADKNANSYAKITYTGYPSRKIHTGVVYPDVPLRKWVNLLLTCHRTQETMVDYRAWDKARQDDAKDIGGYVCGTFAGGKRGNKTLESRTAIVLDADNCSGNTIESLDALCVTLGYTYMLVSTRKSTKAAPRLRIVIPLKHAITGSAAEVLAKYEALVRDVCDKIGMQYFDSSTYQGGRLMYWSSTCSDALFVGRYYEAELLDADEYLNLMYDGNWQDRAKWPLYPDEQARRTPYMGKVAKTETEQPVPSAEKKEDNEPSKNIERQIRQLVNPSERVGLAGLFNRAMHSSIDKVISLLLSDVYVDRVPSTGNETARYTRKGASTAHGAVVYHGTHLYSNHSSDPLKEQLLDPFDLARLALYGDKDKKSKATQYKNLPSYKAMQSLCEENAQLKEAIDLAKVQRAMTCTDKDADKWPKTWKEQVARLEASDKTWQKYLRMSKTGATHILVTANNLMLILLNDPNLKASDNLGYNTLTQQITKRQDTYLGRSPMCAMTSAFSDFDEARILNYLSRVYNMEVPSAMLYQVIREIAEDHHYNPAQEYYSSLLDKWDGKQRLDTMFIDLLGAEDTPYTRIIARKTVLALLYRVFQPGYKIDTMTILQGAQALGKSTFWLKLLCGHDEWGAQNMKRLNGSGDDAGQLIGKILIVVDELFAFEGRSGEYIKGFITQTSDHVRLPYAHNFVDLQRQGIFTATTNKDEPVTDETGLRRYDIIRCTRNFYSSAAYKREGDAYFVQVMAEAMVAYEAGELPYLTHAEEEEYGVITLKQQVAEQHEHMPEELGLVEQYCADVLCKDTPQEEVCEAELCTAVVEENEPDRMKARKDAMKDKQLKKNVRKCIGKLISVGVLTKTNGRKYYAGYGLQKSYKIDRDALARRGVIRETTAA